MDNEYTPARLHRWAKEIDKGGTIKDSGKAVILHCYADAWEQERDELRKRLETDPNDPEWDGIACRDETIYHLEKKNEELRAENERLRELLLERDGGTHDSHEPPADLAPAQLVDVIDRKGRVTRLRADQVEWSQVVPYGGSYRPALSASGLPLCSAEGLGEDANYVATDCTGNVDQFRLKPISNSGLWFPSLKEKGYFRAPSTHRRPGPASEALMEVHRD